MNDEDYKLLWEHSEKRLTGANDWAMGVEAELAQAKQRIAELELENKTMRSALFIIRDHEPPFLGTDCRLVAGKALAKGGTQ